MEVLGIITARGGSQSIPKKNIALCAGEPLMHYCIEAAKHAKLITRLIISTDDQEMADYAKSQGVEVPFMRPKEFAQNTSPDIDTFTHALSELGKSGYRPDAIVHLRPTAPLMRSADLDRAVQMLVEHPQADSVRGVFPVTDTPFKMYKIAGEYLEPLLKPEFPEVYKQFAEPFNAERQLLPTFFRQVGDVDVIRTETIEEGRMNGDHIMPLYLEHPRKVDIDEPHDLEHAGEVINAIRASGKQVWE